MFVNGIQVMYEERGGRWHWWTVDGLYSGSVEAKDKIKDDAKSKIPNRVTDDEVREWE